MPAKYPKYQYNVTYYDSRTGVREEKEVVKTNKELLDSQVIYLLRKNIVGFGYYVKFLKDVRVNKIIIGGEVLCQQSQM